MKVKYSAQCLRPLIFENWNKGLTTLEQLIIILGITIVGAIILPIIFRSQEAEAKKTTLQQDVETTVDAMRDAQQDYFLGKNSFTDSLQELKVSSATKTENYKYSVETTDKSAFLYGMSNNSDFKSYVAAVFAGVGKRTLSASILCKSQTPGTQQIANPTYENGVISCGAGTQELHHGEVRGSK